jgi:hypothetical protein
MTAFGLFPGALSQGIIAVREIGTPRKGTTANRRRYAKSLNRNLLQIHIGRR